MHNFLNARLRILLLAGLVSAISAGTARAAQLTFKFTSQQIMTGFSAAYPTQYPLTGVGLYRVWARPAVTTDRVPNPAGGAQLAPTNALPGYQLTDAQDTALVAVASVWGVTADDWDAAIGQRSAAATLGDARHWFRFQNSPAIVGGGTTVYTQVSFMTTAASLGLGGATGNLAGETLGMNVPLTSKFTATIKTNSSYTQGANYTWLFHVQVWDPAGGGKTFLSNAFYVNGQGFGTPEPSSVVLILSGLLFIPFYRKVKRTSTSEADKKLI